MKIIKVKDNLKKMFLGKNLESGYVCDQCNDIKDAFSRKINKKIANKYKNENIFCYKLKLYSGYYEINYCYFDKEYIFDVCSINKIIYSSACINNCDCHSCKRMRQFKNERYHVKFYNCYIFDYFKDNNYEIIGSHDNNFISFSNLRDAKLFVNSQLDTLVKLLKRQKILEMI